MKDDRNLKNIIIRIINNNSQLVPESSFHLKKISNKKSNENFKIHFEPISKHDYSYNQNANSQYNKTNLI